jgi:hypothetical protein
MGETSGTQSARQSQRVRVDLPARLIVDGAAQQIRIINVSVAGLLLLTTSPPRARTFVSIEVATGASKSLLLYGRVLRVAAAASGAEVAVGFYGNSQKSLRGWRRYFGQLKKARDLV